ncbi:CoA transferase [Myxococcota bacterium]|nr:CoA transferase [Myxococcota bacterium]
MTKPFDGIRVLEVAAWTFVPAAGAILADLGADVIKVEPPTGDPQRGLKNMLNFDSAGPNPFNEIPNRGKRSITLDLKTGAGREALLKIARASDVFLTSYLPELREKLRIDVDDLKAVNPKIIYARGTGWGAQGPMRNTGGYDLAAGWATSGLATHLMRDEDGPAPQPAAFFDLQGGNTIAGSIAMALLHRERTGETPIVDVSLMNVGMWTMAPSIVSAPYLEKPSTINRQLPGNPITNWYETQDGRWIYLVMLQGDRFWPEVCRVIGREDLIEDPRFKEGAARFENRAECVKELDAIFASRPYDEWMEILEALSGVWAPALDVKEIHEHPQVEPNGFLPTVVGHDGVDFRLVSPAMHFDEQPSAPSGPAPELGQHTEAILMDVGLEWDEISKLRERGGLG